MENLLREISANTFKEYGDESRWFMTVFLLLDKEQKIQTLNYIAKQREGLELMEWVLKSCEVREDVMKELMTSKSIKATYLSMKNKGEMVQ